MKISLIQGQFSSQEALELISKMINVKIKFHENRITSSCTEEDIKMREKKIKHLQKDLYEVRNYVSKQQTISMESDIHLNN